MAWPDEAYRMPVDATTDKFVNAVYSSKVINHVRANLVAVATANVIWKEQLAKGNVLYIPVMTTQTATDVDPHTDIMTATIAKSFGTTNESLTIQYWKECPVSIDDSTKTQTNVPDLLNKAADNAAFALMKAIDTTVNTLYSSLTSTWAGSDGQTFSDDILIALMEGLDEADVPRQDRALIGDPSMIADIYKVDKFMSRDYNQTTFTTDAFRGTINAYNLPVFCTNNLVDAGTGNYGALIQREAIGVAIQSEPKVESWREPKFHSDVVNISAFYGADVLRSTHGAYFYTRYN
jgi:hypothetical protein